MSPPGVKVSPTIAYLPAASAENLWHWVVRIGSIVGANVAVIEPKPCAVPNAASETRCNRYAEVGVVKLSWLIPSIARYNITLDTASGLILSMGPEYHCRQLTVIGSLYTWTRQVDRRRCISSAVGDCHNWPCYRGGHCGIWIF